MSNCYTGNMPALPKIGLVVLFIIFSLLSNINSAFAAPTPPDPKPCENTIKTDKLTDNYITDKYGNPPKEMQKFIEIETTAKTDEVIAVTVEQLFEVDFSKLQSIFASSNSNYLEGKFQDTSHRTDSITDLSSQDFNSYYGPGQKVSPKILVDDLRKKYVEYVYNKPTLAESANTYTDIDGKGNPKTVYNLVQEYGLPDPSTSDDTAWTDTWGKYWEKIPTSYQEFFTGKLEFRPARSSEEAENVRWGRTCLIDSVRTIEFSIPEFSRTVSITDQLNQVIVPCSIQSYRHGDTPEADECGQKPTSLEAKKETDTVLASAISACKKLIDKSANGIANALKKAVEIGLDFTHPVKTAHAAVSDDSCVKLMEKGQPGNAPYCAIQAA